MSTSEYIVVESWADHQARLFIENNPEFVLFVIGSIIGFFVVTLIINLIVKLKKKCRKY